MVDAGVFIIYSIITVLITWPLARDPAHLIAETGVNDPILNARFLREVFDWFSGSRAGGLFDANFFFPHPLAFATTDPAIGVALVALPFRLFTGDYLVLVNLVILFTFALTAFTTYLLARQLTGSSMSGFLAGAAFGFCTYRMHQLDHVPILQMQWLPLALFFLHRMKEKPTVCSTMGLAISTFLNGIGSSNIGLYTTPVIAAAALWVVITASREVRADLLIKLLIAGAVSAAALAPFFLPYLRVNEIWGIKRGIGEVKSYSATLDQFLAVPKYNFLYGGIMSRFMGNESATFIGATVILLVIIGLARPASSGSNEIARYGLIKTTKRYKEILTTTATNLITAGFILGVLFLGARMKTPALFIVGAVFLMWAILNIAETSAREGPSDSSAFRFYLVVGLVYGALALGPEVMLNGKGIGNGPWTMISGIPGFGTIRTPSRLFLVTSLSAAVIASLGASWILSGIKRPSVGVAFTMAVVSLILLESWSSPLPTRRMPGLDEAPEVYRWLAARPDKGVLLEVPLCPGTPYGRERMLFSNLHLHPTIDSESSFLLPVMARLDRDRFKDGGAVPYLKKLAAVGLKYVVVHREGVNRSELIAITDTLKKSGALKTAVFGQDDLYVYDTEGKRGPIPFGKDSVAATISVAGKTIAGSKMDLTVNLSGRTDAPVFERKARKLKLDVEMTSGDGKRFNEKVKLWFAPPLLTPGETETTKVSVKMPIVPGSYSAIFRLLDESGQLWAEERVQILLTGSTNGS